MSQQLIHKLTLFIYDNDAMKRTATQQPPLRSEIFPRDIYQQLFWVMCSAHILTHEIIEDTKPDQYQLKS